MPIRNFTIRGIFDSSGITRGFQKIERISSNSVRKVENRFNDVTKSIQRIDSSIISGSRKVETKFNKMSRSVNQTERALNKLLITGKQVENIRPYYASRGTGGQFGGVGGIPRHGISGTDLRFTGQSSLMQARLAAENIRNEYRNRLGQRTLIPPVPSSVSSSSVFQQALARQQSNISGLRNPAQSPFTRNQFIPSSHRGGLIPTGPYTAQSQNLLNQMPGQPSPHVWTRNSVFNQAMRNQGAGLSRVPNMQTTGPTAQGPPRPGGFGASKYRGLSYDKLIERMNRGQDLFNRNLKQTNKSTKDIDKSMRRQGVSFGNLLGLMVKFGVAMQIIMLPGRIIAGFKSIIDTGVQWQKQLQNINSLLGLQQTELIDLGRNISSTSIKYGTEGNVFKTGYDIASTLSDVLLESAATRQDQYPNFSPESIAVAELTRISSEAAIAGVANVEDASEGILRTQSGLKLSIEGVEEAVKSMFKAVDIGIIEFSELAGHIGEVAGQLNALYGGFDEARRLEEFNASTAMLATISRQLPPHETATAMRGIMTSLITRDKMAETNLTFLNENFGVKLQISDMIELGIEGTMREIHRNFGTDGVITNLLLEKSGKTFGSKQEEMIWRRAKQQEMFSAIGFRNKRTRKGINAVLSDDLVGLNEALRADPNSYERAFEENRKSLQNLFNRTSNLWQRIQYEFFLNMEGGIGGFVKEMVDGVSKIVDSEIFQSSTMTEKFRMLWSELITSFTKWYDSGGKSLLEEVGNVIGSLFITIFETVLLNPKVTALATASGIMIGKGIISGMVSVLPKSVTSFIEGFDETLERYTGKKSSGADNPFMGQGNNPLTKYLLGDYIDKQDTEKIIGEKREATEKARYIAEKVDYTRFDSTNPYLSRVLFDDSKVNKRTSNFPIPVYPSVKEEVEKTEKIDYGNFNIPIYPSVKEEVEKTEKIDYGNFPMPNYSNIKEDLGKTGKTNSDMDFIINTMTNFKHFFLPISTYYGKQDAMQKVTQSTGNKREFYEKDITDAVLSNITVNDPDLGEKRNLNIYIGGNQEMTPELITQEMTDAIEVINSGGDYDVIYNSNEFSGDQ